MIRPASPDDAQAMADVLGGWIAATAWMPKLHTQEQDLQFCRHLMNRAEVWVADTRNGFGFLARVGDSIDALYLAPELRRQGWGTAFLDAVRTDRRTLSLWTFQANTGAIAFYQANGFHISDLTDGSSTAERLPDCRMVWSKDTA